MAKTELTIIIATLGEDTLPDTIKSIMASSLLPDKILLSIPEDRQGLVAPLKDENPLIEILPSKKRGQTAQRLLGFQAAKSEYVLQLDSDIVLKSNCLEILMHHIGQHKKLAVGPARFEYNTQAYTSYLVPGTRGVSKLEEKILYFLANGRTGFQEGIISKSGINFGVVKTNDNQIVEWLSGCCILHRRDNLILHDFYPFEGKAYAEDLFHSKMLTDNHIKLCFVGGAKILVKR
ncbi:MAG: glycosyltransferase family A protein, partial [Alphaproteobacteria bacterium]|nr:glycosyltransferase family A protein [Alphaproteobacteria bacterium]